MPPKTLTGLALALALGTTACGSSGAGSPASGSSGPASRPSPARKTAAPGPPARGRARGRERCTAAHLSLSFLGGQGATGHGELGFALRNTGSRRCRTYGFPGIQFLDRAGRPLPTRPIHTTRDFFGPAPEVEVVLGPGRSASFRLGVTHGSGSTAGCATAYALAVIPPGDRMALRASLGRGAYECGTATVSPLRPGRSALG